MGILDHVKDFVDLYSILPHFGYCSHLTVELIDLPYSVWDLLIQAIIWYVSRWFLDNSTKLVNCTLDVLIYGFVVVFELILESLEQVYFLLQWI